MNKIEKLNINLEKIRSDSLSILRELEDLHSVAFDPLDRSIFFELECTVYGLDGYIEEDFEIEFWISFRKKQVRNLYSCKQAEDIYGLFRDYIFFGEYGSLIFDKSENSKCKSDQNGLSYNGEIIPDLVVIDIITWFDLVWDFFYE